MSTTPARRVGGPLTKGLVFVVITTVATAVLAFSVSNTGVRETGGYTARFDTVTQLAAGDDVRMAGVRVGQVESLRIVDRNLAEVSFSVEKAHSLPSDVTATIKYRNLVGQRYIALGRRGDSGATDLPPGATIPLERTNPALDLTDLFNGFKPLFRGLAPDQVDKLSGQIIRVLQGQGGTVEGLLSHISSLTSTLADKDKVIGELIGNLNSVLDTVNARGDQLERLIATVQGITSSFNRDRTAIGDSIQGMAELTNATAGLLEGARPPLREDIAALGELSKNLADDSGTLEEFLTLLPEKFTEIGRSATYGSWFNFYLCEAVLTAPEQRDYTSDAARCQQ